ncbi:MAG: hypothetical protein WA154_09970 [Moraxellaceae bacterium]
MSKLRSITPVASLLVIALTGGTGLTACSTTMKPAAAMTKAADASCGEGKCGAAQPAAAKAADASCGEGKCGAAKPADATKAADARCGEAKCGGAK